MLLAGAQYTITGYVMLTSGEAATNANFTIKRSDPSCSGGTCYDTIGTYQVPVSSTGWAQIGGTYTASTTETGLVLYAQLVGATTAQSFYLDDVVITETAPPPGGTPVATYTFADGGLDGWAPFGSVTLTNAAPPVLDPNSNPRSLLTTNRTATYMGPSLNLLSVNNVVAGATYQVSAYVLLAAADAANPTVTMSTKTADCATTGAYANIATSAPLSNTAWTKVQGTFSFSDLPGPPTSLTLYFQSSSATDSFYISDVVIGELAPPPPNPSQQDNTGITTNFEDGGVDGWSSRSGSSSVTNSTAAAQHRHAQPVDHGAHRQLGWAFDQREQQDVPGLGVQRQRLGAADAGRWVEPRYQREPADDTERQHELSQRHRLSRSYCACGWSLAPGQRDWL